MQDEILQRVDRRKRTAKTCARLIDVATSLDVPITLSEHAPDRFGSVTGRLAKAAGGSATVIAKTHVSCARDQTLGTYLEAQLRFGSTQVVVAGVETHLAVCQTVMDLRERGFHVFAVADAMSSRRVESHALGLERMRHCGAEILDFEMVLSEWMDRTSEDALDDLHRLID